VDLEGGGEGEVGKVVLGKVGRKSEGGEEVVVIAPRAL
jgi:hypothetical protein